jgi:hypothetical protein
MQQMSQMNSMSQQQHQYIRPQSSTRHQPQTAGGMPYVAMGFPASSYMFGTSQGLSSVVPMASRPHLDFNSSRQPSLQEQMNFLQQNEQKNLQKQIQSQLRQQTSTLPEPNSRLAHHSPRIGPNSPQGSASSLSALSEHRVIEDNADNLNASK